MKKSRAATLIAGALVLGLALGGLGIATARNGSAASLSTATSSASQMRGASLIQALSSLTGLSVQQIMALRAQGKSFATIATDNGVDPAAVVDKTVAARQAKLDALLASGTITPVQEAASLAKMRARVEAAMNAVPTFGNSPSGEPTATPSIPTTGGPGMGWLHANPRANLDATGTPSAQHASMMGKTQSAAHRNFHSTTVNGHHRGASSMHRRNASAGAQSNSGNSGHASNSGSHGSGMGSQSGMMGSRN